jgi:preprotein translocase subunit SecE
VSDSKAVRGPRGGNTRKRTTLPVFYRQVVAELRKVVYPTQEQLVTYFIVVMVFVIVLMAIVAGLDLGFGKLAFKVFGG